MSIKLKSTLFIIAFVFFINIALSQEKKKIAIIINTGYPIIISDFPISYLEKKNNLLFLELGIEKYMSKQVFYSFSLSTSNMYYKTSSEQSVLGGLLGKYLMSRIGMRLNIWKEFTLQNSNIFNVGFGFNGCIDIYTWLEEKSKSYKRSEIFLGLIGVQIGAKYYFKIKDKNSLGIIVESNYLFGIFNFDLGIGLAYKHNF